MAARNSRIIVAEADRFSRGAAAILRECGEVAFADLDRAGLLREANRAEVLWVRLRHRIDAEVLAAAPRLGAIVSATTGLDHIDLEGAARRGISVLSLRGEVDFLKEIRATAEHTIGLALALLRELPGAAAHVLKGGWDRDRFRGHELHGKTAGIVGLGRLGTIVAECFQAFGMRTIATDPRLGEADVLPGVTLVPLQRLLHEADLVTLHVNLCAETEGMWGREQFAAMKAGSWFINTSRGELVDEAALLHALHSGHVAGAALDVVRGENARGMAAHPLIGYARDHENLIITPHLGGCTVESMEKTEVFMAEKLRGWLSAHGKPCAA